MKSCTHLFAEDKLRYIISHAFVLVLIMSSASIARATCPPEVSPSPSVQEVLKEPAQLLYDQGEQLLAHEPKDYAKALELFMKSRAVYPSPDNSLMAAMCLRQLGRYPEALALYEEILTQFHHKLEDREKNEFQKYVLELRDKVIIADIIELTGTFSIDDESCGSLPRAEPVYLMPGSHIFRVLRRGQPEFVSEFSGAAGARISVKLPKPPELPRPPPENGRWFLQGSVGPAIAWSGIGTLSIGNLEQSTGVLAQGYGGYRLPNGIMLGLNAGLLYLGAPDPVPFRQSFEMVRFEYSGTYEREIFSWFGGPTVGWSIHMSERSDVWIRGGFGLMSTQAKQFVVDASLARTVEFVGAIDEKYPVRMIGDEVDRSIPTYANIEIGGSVRVGPLRIGLSLGGLFILDEGPNLAFLDVLPAGRDPASFHGCSEEFGRDNIDCVPNLRFSKRPAYSRAFVLLPQLVIGF